MENENNNNNTKGSDYKKFATPRIIGGIAIAVIILWALSIFFGPSDQQTAEESTGMSHNSEKTATVSHSEGQVTKSADTHTTDTHTAQKGQEDGSAKTNSHDGDAGNEHSVSHDTAATHATEDHSTASAEKHAADSHSKSADNHRTEAEQSSNGSDKAASATASHQEDAHAEKAKNASAHKEPEHASADTHATPASGHPLPESVHSPAHKPKPKGVAFVEAAIEPLQLELEERWWGWRANDLINVTDNVENFQMGVLEVTRRTTVALAERISRTGTTDSFDENLEQAMNWFMVKSSSYWFPSAESKYKDGLEELENYLQKLKKGNATFYTRTDNLIPLLASFEDLLGSCDENLVKHTNEDGTPISFFVVDDYFYYTQGVASSMAVILEAVHHDFLLTLESRHGTELLHHAIVSCQRASGLDPWIVLDRDLSSVFANHRANMAAPISHARFYLGQLIKTLST